MFVSKLKLKITKIMFPSPFPPILRIVSAYQGKKKKERKKIQVEHKTN